MISRRRKFFDGSLMINWSKRKEYKNFCILYVVTGIINDTLKTRLSFIAQSLERIINKIIDSVKNLIYWLFFRYIYKNLFWCGYLLNDIMKLRWPYYEWWLRLVILIIFKKINIFIKYNKSNFCVLMIVICH